MLEIAHDSFFAPEALWFLLLAPVLLALTQIMKTFNQKQKLETKTLKEKSPQDDEIEPLWDFDFRKVDPIKYQPYKTQGHVTMGK